MRKLLLSTVLLASTTAFADDKVPPFHGDVPSMIEEAAAAGVNHRYDGPWEFFVGGGVASFDCNGDRMPDLFFAGGANPAQLFINRSTTGGALRFEAKATGLSEAQGKKVSGAYPINIDNDEHMDLVVLRLGENIVLRGEGDCQFSRANLPWALEGGRAWTTGFSATWKGEDIFPTLAFANYVDRSAPGTPWGTCEDNALMRPREGAKTPNYSETMALRPGYCALSILFTDWNRSGNQDLRVTNDRQYYRGGSEQLWRVPERGAPRLYSRAQGWQPLRIWGMGIAQADLDGNGWPEYALSSMGDTMLQTLDPDVEGERPTYRDGAFEKRMTAHRPYTGTDLKPSTGWHTQFADFNNDAKLDLFIAKGNVEAMPDFAAFDPDNMLMGGADGGFHEVGNKAGIALARRGRGAAVVDLNADGMLDLVVVNRADNVSLFRNQGHKTDWGHQPLGNWLAVELRNVKINGAAVGAKVSVKTGNLTQTRTIQIGGGHASGQAGFLHFGLGVAERATVRIQWPNGDWSHGYRVFANKFVQITRGKADARYWYPRPAPDGQSTDSTQRVSK
ncbi:MAG: CRTAC1 family protein [Pseudomonadota bacterium]